MTMNLEPAGPRHAGRRLPASLRALAGAALYLLLALYSGHLIACGSEFAGHEAGELAQVKTETASEATWSLAPRPVALALLGAGSSDHTAAVSAAAPVMAALFAALLLVLPPIRARGSPRSAAAGQPVGRWYRTVILQL